MKTTTTEPRQETAHECGLRLARRASLLPQPSRKQRAVAAMAIRMLAQSEVSS